MTGVFEGRELEPGQYVLDISADGYTPIQREIQLGSGKVEEIAVTLEENEAQAFKKPVQFVPDWVSLFEHPAFQNWLRSTKRYGMAYLETFRFHFENRDISEVVKILVSSRPGKEYRMNSNGSVTIGKRRRLESENSYFCIHFSKSKGRDS